MKNVEMIYTKQTKAKQKRSFSFAFRVVALGLAINFMVGIFAPTLSWALTAGPTSPEFSSFEPIDVTDMVNLASGDLTYSIPLIEVPGPEGGYPLSLSYHSGIQPDLEASWVGLGWTLNPGAINRYLNGYADDVYNAEESVESEWVGGATEAFTVGVGYGPVYYGVTFANDTYRGTGVGMSANFGIPIYKEVVNVGIGIEIGPYGGANVNLGVSVSAGDGTHTGTVGSGVQAGANLGVSYDLESEKVSVYGGGGISYGSAKSSRDIMGVSMNSSGGGAFSIAGSDIASINSNEGFVSTQTSSFGIPIPIPYVPGAYIYLGHSYTRYFSQTFDNTHKYGSLYHFPFHSPNPYNDPTNQNTMPLVTSFDSYPTIDPANYSIDSDPNADMGGSMPAFDMYSVLGQGIGGAIKPYVYDLVPTYRKSIVTYNNNGNAYYGINYGESNIFDENYNSYQSDKLNTGTVGRASFRFVNDFSNKFTRDVNLNTVSDLGVLENAIYTSSKTISNSNSITQPDFNTSKGMLVGSRHVEWFTNEEIANGDAKLAGLMLYSGNNTIIQEIGSNVVYDVSKQIGGYAITNESGVTYHYALPVYNYKNGSKTCKNGCETIRTTYDNQPYAYTWLLTGITGPDFVDKGSVEGQIDESDWGYWIKFDYGKWTQEYKWRNPADGMVKDVDSDSDFKSWGVKEVYYLDAIKSRTHTALFVKDIRNDAKGVINTENGGFGRNSSETSVATLKLDRVLLFTNAMLDKKLTELNNNGLGLDGLKSKTTTLDYLSNNIKWHIGSNVLDVYDIAYLGTETIKGIDGKDLVINSLTKAAVREIVFKYDYNLCKNTPNSYPDGYDKVALTGGNGKLTLNEVYFNGESGLRSLPPITFSYNINNNPDYNKKMKDIWGFYKSNYNTIDGYDEPINSYPDNKHDATAWSLETINTSLGASIKVKYESDSYNKSVFLPARNFSVRSLELINNDPSKIRLKLYNFSPLQFKDLILSQEVSLVGTLEYSFLSQTKLPDNTDCFPSLLWSDLKEDKMKIKNIGTDYIDLDFPPGKQIVVLPASVCGVNPIYPSMPMGNLYLNFAQNPEVWGGGIRVESISVQRGNIEQKTKYTYKNGSTPYEPSQAGNIRSIQSKSPLNLGTNIADVNGVYLTSKEIFKTCRNASLHNLKDVMANSVYLPSPGVVYGEVEMTDETINYAGENNNYTSFSKPGKVVYKFYTLDANMFKREVLYDGMISGRFTKHIRYQNMSSLVGSLKSITHYGPSSANPNTMEIIGEQKTHYLFDEVSESNSYSNALSNSVYQNQGRLEQVFYEKRKSKNNEQFMLTEYEELPNVITGTSSLDLKRGLSSSTSFLAYDKFSGKSTATYTQDAYGNAFLTEVKPAYTVQDYSSMGSKSVDIHNKNMLSQTCMNATYKVNSTLNPSLSSLEVNSLTGAYVQTWKKGWSVMITPSLYAKDQTGIELQEDIWRKQGSYQYIGTSGTALNADGTFPTSSKVLFNLSPSQLLTNSAWEKSEEMVLYNKFSFPLEVKDMNDHYNASLPDPLNQQYILANATNARYLEIAACGAEFLDGNGAFEGNVDRVDGVYSPSKVHTGVYSLLLQSNKIGMRAKFIPILGKKYKASVWVFPLDETSISKLKLSWKQNGVVKSVSPISNKNANGWYLTELIISPSGTGSVEVFCENTGNNLTFYLDDFRLSPLSSSITTYVYDRDKAKITHILDANNMFTRFQYDHTGKLVSTYQEKFGPVGESLVQMKKYNYGK